MMSWETVSTSCHASHVVIKRAASSFHIVELALLDTCDQSLDADVFLGVLVQNMVSLRIRSDASDVFSASMSQRSDLQDPKKGKS